jgi:iron-sulfur cluster assembly protein
MGLTGPFARLSYFWRTEFPKVENHFVNPMVRYLLEIGNLRIHMITVSDNAKEYIVSLMAEQKAGEAAFVRVGVKSGGCSGLEYQLDFDTAQKEGDQVFEDKGVKVVVDLKSLLYLYGTELDYSGGLNGKGLFFNNPNASRTCSCGESFAV